MHGVNEDFGAAISTGFDEAIPTVPHYMATHVPLRTLTPPWNLSAMASNSRTLETVAVIAIWRSKIRFQSRRICEPRQHLIRIAI